MIEHTINIGRLALVSGESLDAVQQRVTIYGDRHSAREIVLVTHALTGNSRAADWWASLIGPGRLFDPQRACIVCINALGSCYGSTGPSTTVGVFPTLAVTDIVNAQARALSFLGIERVDRVIGGSLGGMQALQWALSFPQRTGEAIIVGAYDYFSAQGIALNSVAREAIHLDPVRGPALARKIAMISYKSEALLEERHGNRLDRAGRDRFDIEGYLDYQGAIFSNRMDAASYVTLTRAMDRFDVRDARISERSVRLHFIGISSDWLFSPHLVERAAQRFARAGFDSRYSELVSAHGHDAFLSEGTRLAELVGEATAISGA